MKYSVNLFTKGLVCALFLTLNISGVYSQCVSNCEIQCLGHLNVSLDEFCQATITPATGGIGITDACNSYYDVDLYDAHGNHLPSNIVDLDQLNQTITYQITEPECGNKCWGTLLVEYKQAPVVECPDDITISCGALDFLDLPPVTGSGCASALVDVRIIGEVKTLFECDPDFTGEVVRSYIAEDNFGNTTTCSHTVTLQRVDFSDVVFPPDATISCNDTMMRFNPDGVPIPWYTQPFTGSGSGMGLGLPILCSSGVSMGLFCPTSGMDSGIPLIPLGGAIVLKQTSFDPADPGYAVCELDDEVIRNSQQQLCSALLTYTDVKFDAGPCKRKVIRTWEIREWWCNDELTFGDIQLIQIIDDSAPAFKCPADFTVSTSHTCAGDVNLPPVTAVDECGTDLSYLITYPNGSISTNGGPVNLNLGNNLVTYAVSDACYNQSTCQVNVTVEDNTNPVAICETRKVISLSASNNTIVFAEPFDNGSWDECGLDKFEVRRMDSICVAQDTLFGPSVTFCCSDANTEVMVVFRVYDKKGNYNDCMVRVEVQDKSVPALLCPPDQTIDCLDGYDMNNLSQVFGNPTLGDNCSSQNIIETIVDDIDQCGIGSMIRQFELHDLQGNVLRSCKQNITVSYDTPFLASNIQWPLDYETSNTCSAADLDPQDLPALYDFPTFLGGDDQCSLLGYDYDDKVFETTVGNNACVRIERTWTVINWCGASNGTFDQFTIPTPQVIEIINTQAPVILDANPVLVESQNIDCQSGPIQITRTASDDCDNLIWSYTIVNQLGNVVKSGDVNTLDYVLPVGDYIINWTVQDGCGNSDNDNQVVEVVNTKAPTPVCLNGLSANLVLMDTDNDGQIDNEMVELWASDFNAGSSHSCGNPIVLSLSADTTDKVVVYDCNDIGIQEVRLWVTDARTGSQDFCVTFIDIQDNNGDNFCNPTDIKRVVVEGQVYTEVNEMVENVEVSLANNAPSNMTNIEGEYAFGNMPLGGDYDLTPSKDENYLKGVSTFDLVLIQNHILGNMLLDSPYKLIAADADDSANITALDLIALRKLILGVYSELPENASWRFVDAEYEFLDPANPWTSQWPESYEIYGLSTDMEIDFIGVKIGDVNNSYVSNIMNGDLQERHANVLRMKTSATQKNNGDIQKVQILADDYKDISGWQTTLAFDNEQLELVSIEGVSIPFNQDVHANFSSLQNGLIPMSFVHEQLSSVENGQAIMELTFKVNSEIAAGDLISFNSEILKTEAYKNITEKYTLDLIADEVVKAHLLSVSPNPWMDEAKIEFVLPEDGDVKYEFYDLTGRLLFANKANFNEGINTIKVEKTQLNTSGVVYVKLMTKNNIIKHKMIVL